MPFRRFQLRILATVVLNRRAIDDNVSPRFTWYKVVADDSLLDGETAAGPLIAREATALGAAGLAFDVIRPVGARGITSV